MKSIILSSTLIALLAFSGCSSKDPVIDETKQEEVEKDSTSTEAVETEVVETDTTTVTDENGIVSTDSNEKSMLSLEREMITIYFDYDKFAIRDDMVENVSIDAEIAKKEASKFIIKLEGNCDEWGSDEYNFALGLKRASTVKNAMIAEGVAASRITMVSFGESNPTCNEKTRECWAKNRRVDFKLLP